MSYTRSQMRTRIAQEMDAVNSPRWDFTASGEVDKKTGLLYDLIWKEILESNPYYFTDRLSLTPDANGQVPLTSFSTGSGDTLHRFNKIIAIGQIGVGGQFIFDESRLVDLPFARQMGFLGYTWNVEGANIQLLPVQQVALAFLINYLPVPYAGPTGLSGDSAVVPWPDGWEEVLVHRAAAANLTKGGEETEASMKLEAYGLKLQEAMLRDLSRRSLKPPQMRSADSPQEWASQ